MSLAKLNRRADHVQTAARNSEREALQIKRKAEGIAERINALREDMKEVQKILNREGIGHGSEGSTFYNEDEGRSVSDLNPEEAQKLREEVVRITQDTEESESIDAEAENIEQQMEENVTELKNDLEGLHSALESLEEAEGEVKEVIKRSLTD